MMGLQECWTRKSEVSSTGTEGLVGHLPPLYVAVVMTMAVAVTDPWILMKVILPPLGSECVTFCPDKDPGQVSWSWATQKPPVSQHTADLRGYSFLYLCT